MEQITLETPVTDLPVIEGIENVDKTTELVDVVQDDNFADEQPVI